MVENLSRHRIGEVVTDNARALSMGKKREICEKEGTMLSIMVSYHRASNGVAERAIGGLTTRRAPLKFLWAEAYTTTIYVHNGTSTGALGGLTPYEACYGAKRDVAPLRAFGAPCHIVELQARLQKLGDRASTVEAEIGFGSRKGALLSSPDNRRL